MSEPKCTINFVFYENEVPSTTGEQLLATYPDDFEAGTTIHKFEGLGDRPTWVIEGFVSRKLFREFQKLLNL